MRAIHTKYSRNSKGHYVPGMIHNDTLYISGQLSLDLDTGEIVEGGIAAETKRALENMEMVLKEADLTKKDIVMVRLYTSDVDNWDIINEEYSNYFGDHKPARAVVPTRELHYGCLIEIEAVAAIK
ncbi:MULTISPECIES: RidA family protein [Jeotgalicoccus]|jgi:Putative translation initiation inhibitor, yjgF family|uniref:RidA family protein n=1 Tax=Jeotgalicoccus nanhaiensis TaxID=568603 RepID=A0ABR9XYD9_9STAP|nr:RidA family protein [Jeotgalicoccus nanhaiensis]MBF0753873.1 RidA family protein [Jeotgalicoccus nanhaiensis]TFU62032.1 RidA family protein [Jeotgalicoccus nanhaiensis]